MKTVSAQQRTDSAKIPSFFLLKITNDKQKTVYDVSLISRLLSIRRKMTDGTAVKEQDEINIRMSGRTDQKCHSREPKINTDSP